MIHRQLQQELPLSKLQTKGNPQTELWNDMITTMLKVAKGHICKNNRGRVLINNKSSLLSIIIMRIIIMVIITTIIDLSVLIPVLTPILELFYLIQHPWNTDDGDDKNNIIRYIILNTIFMTLCRSFKYIIL